MQGLFFCVQVAFYLVANGCLFQQLILSVFCSNNNIAGFKA